MERPVHMHCPLNCYHPQPFERDGHWYCGCCYFSGCMPEGTLTEMSTDAEFCNCGAT